jgi:hypothetical protein
MGTGIGMCLGIGVGLAPIFGAGVGLVLSVATGLGTGVGAGVEVGVGVGSAGVAPGAPCSLLRRFFPVPFFLASRRGTGVACGCAIEFPSLLKKSPIGLEESSAAEEITPARITATERIKEATLCGNFIIFFTLHVDGDRFNISRIQAMESEGLHKALGLKRLKGLNR